MKEESWMKLVNLEMPKTENEYGVFNVKGMPNVYYRFEMQDGIATLMEDFFANNQPEHKKFNYLPKMSELYKTIQDNLTEYLKNDSLASLQRKKIVSFSQVDIDMTINEKEKIRERENNLEL